MKINVDVKKSAEVVSNVLKKTSDISKKAAENVQKGARVISDKAKSESYLRRMKKYNPLFPEQYNSTDFNRPNMIMIVDDAVRRGIDVCEGAIGWINKENGMEVLYLYDEAVAMSGIQFIPKADCDAVYYVDSFDRNRFVKLDCIFSKAHEERIAELKHIAYSLGAKNCTIEIVESNVDVKIDHKQAALREGLGGCSAHSNEKAEQSLAYTGSNQRSGRVVVQFEGSNNPKRPELKWFAQDDNIKRLVEMRCKNRNAIKSEILELSGSSSCTMSQKTAYAIDCALGKIGMNGNWEMESRAKKECHSKMVYCIEF